MINPNFRVLLLEVDGKEEIEQLLDVLVGARVLDYCWRRGSRKFQEIGVGRDMSP